MRIVITGVTGLLGTALVERLEREDHELTGLAMSSSHPAVKTLQCDITDAEATYATVSRLNPDVVIHTAAHANVDDCERDPDKAFRVNALGTRNVAAACQRFDSAMVYISTDYVFSGRQAPKDGYTEFDPVEPASVYGRSKLAGEQFVRQLLGRFYIVRPSWLFGRKRANFVTQTADALLHGKPVNMVTDMVSAPTHVGDLSDAIARLIGTTRYGTYHLSNKGFASRYDIACTIAAMLGTGCGGINKLQLKDLSLPAPRPAFSGMRNYCWELEGFAPLRPWQESVAEFLGELLSRE